MILITGKNGQLGWELRRALAPLGSIAALDASELPLEDTGAIRRVIRKLRPTIVVNTAAHTDPDRAGENGDLAMAVNGVAPTIIADEVKRLGGGVPHLIFRTNWVYCARGSTFLRTTLDTAAAGKPLRAINDQRGAPTWCRMVAEATALVLAQTGAAQRPDALEDYGGTYHLSAAGETTWFEFARAILQRAPEPLRTRATQVTPMATRESPAGARRPANALLDCTKFTETFGFALPDWRESLDLVMEDLCQGESRGLSG